MADGTLPREGPLQLGSVTLPAGRLITAEYGSGEPVAWATVDPVLEPGRLWAALSEIRDQTGLVPILLDGLHGDTSRPWDSGEFEDPEDPRDADALDPSALLKACWDRRGWPNDDHELAAQRGPFGREFPGLAPPEHTPQLPAKRQYALDSVLPQLRASKKPRGAARIGLIAADRPADVLATIGWMGCLYLSDHPLLTLCAVLRSWEDRFGAVLVDVGFADIRLLVARPPRTLQAAERVAAEHFALADECTDCSRVIPSIAVSLVKAPIWTFWWD
jgi:Domain of unknown function (DUF4253)